MPVSNETDTGGSYSVQRPRPTAVDPGVMAAAVLTAGSVALQAMFLEGAPRMQVAAFVLSVLALVALVYVIARSRSRSPAAVRGPARAVGFLPFLTVFDEGAKIPIAAGATTPMPAEFIPGEGCRFAFYNATGQKLLAVSPEVFSTQASVALTLCTRSGLGGAEPQFHCHVTGDTIPA